jgi:hypothetical protein
MELDFGTYDIHAPLPVMYPLRQRLDSPEIEDIAGEVRRRLDASGLLDGIRRGQQIALTGGSRGVHHQAEVLRAVAAAVRDRGAAPFVVPAMGSHAGATAEGQVAMLAGLGVTEETVGAPIRATMDVVPLGQVPDGPALFMDAYAAAADGIIIVHRVKPHTDFHGPIESGLSKMTVIGLGKQVGAEAMHRYGAPGLRTFIPPAAQIIVAQRPVLGGVALVENGHGGVAEIAVLAPAEFGGPAEQRLLETARRLLPGLPFDQLDVLVVDEIGKNYSGTGMDTTVIGRVLVPDQEENPRPRITAIVALGMSAESRGNAGGLGMADVTTRRLVEQINFYSFYLNGITSGTFGLRRSHIPFVMQDDYTAVALALHATAASHPTAPRLARIRNTLDVETLLIAESLVAEAQAAGGDVGPPLGPLAFGPDGRIAAWPADED